MDAMVVQSEPSEPSADYDRYDEPQFDDKLFNPTTGDILSEPRAIYTWARNHKKLITRVVGYEFPDGHAVVTFIIDEQQAYRQRWGCFEAMHMEYRKQFPNAEWYKLTRI